MRFASLGSGSKGNGTLVSSGNDCLLIDCGFSIKETEARLARLNLTPQDITAIAVTHEHSDHFKGVMPLAKKYQLPVSMTAGTFAKFETGHHVNIIGDEEAFNVGSLKVTPVAVPHDAREPVQFIVESSLKKLGVLTDLGKITPHVEKHFNSCDGLLIEANHDWQMLQNGSYPPALKRRVSGDWGHLNNEQTLSLLESVDLERIQHLVLAHISEQNNSVEKVKNVMSNVVKHVENPHYACQKQGFDWLNLE